jgi:immune inhibitor A
MKAKWLSISLILAMLVIATVPLVSAAPTPPPMGELLMIGSPVDDAPHPLGTMQRTARQEAFEAQAHGGVHGNIHRLKHGKYVELEREGEDTIWTVIGEFGPNDHPAPILYSGIPGPLHNEIPEPDRSVDNTTIWTSDFNTAYYEKMLFSEAPGAISMRKYYIEQSSNRYAVNGEVTDWVQVPYNAAAYGRNYCGDIVCAQTWVFVDHSVDAWYNDQIAAGMTPADIDAYLSQFDVWDRYDWDGDGNFDEPDGYIDHFQSVHAGEGEETGGGAQGEDAIWSHRWYAYYNNIGFTGPSPDYLLGGVQIGGSNYWIGDYTVEPENGGVGVFAHEFGHDLGLPDLYDTSGNTGGAENSTGFWTLYSSGSYGSSGKPKDGIGTKPTHMSALEKIMLGWSNLHTVNYGDNEIVKLGPAEFNTIDAQHLMVVLPDKEVDFQVGSPYDGSFFYYSGSGNDLDNSMSRSVTLPAGAVTLTAQVNYEIELDWDYAYLTVNGVSVPTNLSTNTNPNGQNFGEGITGFSGGWVTLTADLSAFAGQTVDIGFRYWTDVAVAESGINVDNIEITGLPLDDAETDPGWVYAGFTRTDGVVTESFFNAYIAEFRQYVGYDTSLKTGPYNFGFLDNPNLQNWVEHFPYQDGLLVWYYDESFPDNNVGDYCLEGRCGGLFLPVDAHPQLMLRPDNGQVWRPRIQSYDSTFSVFKTNKICLHANSMKKCYGNLRGNSVFDDTDSYWFPPDASIGHAGWASVPLPGFGVKIRILAVLPGSGGSAWYILKVDS